MADVVLKSMRLSKKEARNDTVEAGEMLQPQYPWGLTYTLNEEVLEKLGDSLDDYEIGEEYYLYAKCKVTGKSMHEYENGPARECVDLQITDLRIEDTDGDEQVSKKPSLGEIMYGEDS